MSVFSSPRFLRTVLWADAASGAGTGALQLALAAPLALWLGLPQALLWGSGIAIFAFVALAAHLARQPVPPRGLLGLLVAGNWAWVAACLGLAFGGVLSPTPLGQAYLLVQAVAVAVLAELQWLGLRRVVPAGWA